jgi:hypothetical protein
MVYNKGYMKHSDFLEIINSEPICDIMVSGYIDSENPPIFHPLYERLYFFFSDSKVEIYLGEDSLVNFKFFEQVEQWTDVDEDDKFSMMSIYSLVFKTEQQVSVTSFTCDDLPFSKLKISYIQADVEKNVTFDPRNFFGFSFNC